MHHSSLRHSCLAALCGVVLLAACGGYSAPTGTSGGGPPQGQTPPANGNVTIQDFSFSPETVTVKVGQSVLWTNNGPMSHTTTSDDGAWDSGQLAAPATDIYGNSTSGGTFKFTFSKAGTFPYHCSNHPQSQYPNFRGVVVVTP